MKKLRLVFGIVSVALSMFLMLSNTGKGGFEYLSDADGAALMGGACVSVPSGTLSCSGLKKGCVTTQGEKVPDTTAGSWTPDTPLNCGVIECGTALKTKVCGS